MDARLRTRCVKREKSDEKPQRCGGAKQVVIPLDREQYDDLWRDPAALKAYLDDLAAKSPELFPEGWSEGYALHGLDRESRKLPGIRWRKIVLANGSVYRLRPGFALSYCMGTVDELSYPLLLATHGVPPWLLTLGFGHSDMFWYRLVERLGRNSLVGSTVRDPRQLPEHLAADEHHVDWSGEKGYVAVTAAEGCLLGMALTPAADDAHLQTAYGVFAAEARDVAPEYAPKTVNTDGWAATQNAFPALFSSIVVVLCFLHGFLKIRDRCRKNHDLHRRVWDVSRAVTALDFRRLMGELLLWCATQKLPAPVTDMVTKLSHKTESYAVAYEHPGCRRTSNTVDRPMNRLHRLVYANRGLHGHQSSSERRLRGWALLLNFSPFAHRSNQARPYDSPAHRLNQKRYHENWLLNLVTSTSLMGFRSPAPKIR